MVAPLAVYFGAKKGYAIAIAVVILICIILTIVGAVLFFKDKQATGFWMGSFGLIMLGFMAWNKFRSKSYEGGDLGIDLSLIGEQGINGACEKGVIGCGYCGGNDCGCNPLEADNADDNADDNEMNDLFDELDPEEWTG